MAYQPTTNFGWAMPRGGDQAQISVINQQFTAKADEIVYQTRRMIAPGYIDDGSKTYQPGEIVEYENVDYVCTGTTSGAWDSSKWDSTDMATQIQEAKESGGTEVEANPVEAATADLHKLKVENTVYGIPDPTVTKTATGNPIELTDGADAPLVKCVTQITGYQSGTGTPSPDNIRPITAYTEGEIEVSDGDGNTITHETTYPSAIYRGSEDVVGGSATKRWGLIVYDGSESWIQSTSWVSNNTNIFYCSTVLTDAKFDSWDDVSFLANEFEAKSRNYAVSNDVVCICYSGSYGYAPYITVRVYKNDIADVTAFKTFLYNHPLQIAYELATPTTSPVTVSNLPIRTLSGYNHIESTTGDMEVEYITQTYQPLVDLIDEAADTKHAYSTTEHVVGKWIDGKDVYERTVHLDSLSSSPLDWETLFQESVGVIVSVTGCFLRTTGEMCDIGSTSFRVCYNPTIHQGYVCYYYTESNISEFTITVRYTKTSSNNRSLSTLSKGPSEEVTEKVEEPVEKTEEPAEKTEEPVEEPAEKEENAGESNSENER